MTVERQEKGIHVMSKKELEITGDRMMTTGLGKVYRRISGEMRLAIAVRNHWKIQSRFVFKKNALPQYQQRGQR